MSTVNDQQQQRNGLPFWQQAVVLLVSCAVIVSRRPDAVFHAQFYAEDGHVWFADAYNLGWWHALLRTWSGYFLTLPRIGASLALLVPLYRVPLLLNLIAIFFQALPANVLLSQRSTGWGTLRFRFALAVVYLVLPNSDEVTRSITDANWPLALSSFMILVAAVPEEIASQLFDIAILLLCGLTGPFCLFLLPIAVFLAWKHRESWRWVPASIFGACCILQGWALIFLAPASRAHRALGASKLDPEIRTGG